MKRYIVPLLVVIDIILLLLVFSRMKTQAQNPADRIIGIWLNEKQTTKIEILKTGNTYSGKIVWLARPNDAKGNPYLDKRNPDLNKRNQKILGLTIITGLKYSNTKWIGGTLYGPKYGQYLNCSITLTNSGQLQMTVSQGSWSETKTWTKS